MVEAAPLERVVHLAGAVRRDDRRWAAAAARIVPSSGIVTWKSESSSSRKASNGSSVRSSSSISSTGGPAGSGYIASSSGRRRRNCSRRGRGRACAIAASPAASAGADLEHLAGEVPLVERGGDVEALVALQPDQAAAERARQHLGDLGLADAGLALEQQVGLQRKEDDGREVAAGDVAGAGKEGAVSMLAGSAGMAGHMARLDFPAAAPPYDPPCPRPPASIDATRALLAGAGYIAGRDLATVVFLALKLGRPLFLEGEAGVGKTEIAKALARGARPPR